MRWLAWMLVIGTAACTASRERDDGGADAEVHWPPGCPAREPELRVVDQGILDLGTELELVTAGGDGRTVLLTTATPGLAAWTLDVTTMRATPLAVASGDDDAPLASEALRVLRWGTAPEEIRLWELRGAVLTSLGPMVLPGPALADLVVWDGAQVIVGAHVDDPSRLWLGPWARGPAPEPWHSRRARDVAAALAPDGLHVVVRGTSPSPDGALSHLVLDRDGRVTSETLLEDVGYTSGIATAWLPSSGAPLVLAGHGAAGAGIRRFRADGSADGGVDVGGGAFAFTSTAPGGARSGYGIVSVRDTYTLAFHAELDGRASAVHEVEGPCATSSAAIAASPCGYALFCTFRGAVRSFLAIPAAP